MVVVVSAIAEAVPKTPTARQNEAAYNTVHFVAFIDTLTYFVDISFSQLPAAQRAGALSTEHITMGSPYS